MIFLKQQNLIKFSVKKNHFLIIKLQAIDSFHETDFSGIANILYFKFKLLSNFKFI